MWEHAQALQWKDRTSKHKLTENMKVPSSGQERIEAEQENISIYIFDINLVQASELTNMVTNHKFTINI
jgi:hypothetical protein